MAYSDVEWTSGDTPTNAKLVQMVDNLDELRDNFEEHLVGSSGHSWGWEKNRVGGWPAGTGYQLRIEPAGYTFPITRTFDGTWGTSISGSIDISAGLTDRIVNQRLVVYHDADGGWTYWGDLGRFYFWRPVDLGTLQVEVESRATPARKWNDWSGGAGNWGLIETRNLAANLDSSPYGGGLPWTAVSWTSGNTITDTKLNQMIANQDALRGEYAASCKILGQDLFNQLEVSAGLGFNNPWQYEHSFRFRVLVGQSLFSVPTAEFENSTGWINLEAKNLDISGLQNNRMTRVELFLEERQFSDAWPTEPPTSWGPPQIMARGGFWKTDALNFVSFAGRFRKRLGHDFSFLAYGDSPFGNFNQTIQSYGWAVCAHEELSA